MSILATVAKYILVADAKLQAGVGNFFYKRSQHLRAAAAADIKAADSALTVSLVQIDKNHRKQLALLQQRLESQRQEAIDKANALNAIQTSDAEDDIRLGESIASFGLDKMVAASKARGAVDYLEGRHP